MRPHPPASVLRALLVFLATWYGAVLPGRAAAQGQTAAEWRAEVAREATAEAAAIRGTDREYIRLGAAICGADHPGKTSIPSTAQLDPRWSDAVARFATFMDGEGLALLRKWRGGATLAPGESEFLPEIQFTFLSQASKSHRDPKARRYVPALTDDERLAAEAYKAKVEADGQALLKRWYAQAGERRLTREQLETLRLFHRAEGVDCVGGLQYLPAFMGIGPLDPRKPEPGTPMPDFRLFTLEAALRSPSYSDTPPYEAMITAPLRPDGVTEYLLALDAYGPGADGKVISLPARLADLPGEGPGDRVRLSELHKEKPVVLILPDAIDCFWPRAFPLLEPIYRAYRDRFHFRIINVTIHDLFMFPDDEFFVKVPSGQTGYFVGHPVSVEERARTAKNLCMGYPWVSVPWLLDDTASTANNDFLSQGGEADVCVIDRDGRLAQFTQAAFNNVLWANEVETSLREIAANGGRVVPGKGFAPVLPQAKASAGQRLTFTLPAATVESAGDNRLVVRVKLGADEKRYTLAVGAFTRLAREGKPCAPEAFRPGETVSVRFWGDAYFSGPLERRFTKRTAEYRGELGEYDLLAGGRVVGKGKSTDGSGYWEEGWFHQHLLEDSGDGAITPRRIELVQPAGSRPVRIWFCGRVKSVDPSSRTVEVTRPKPAADELLGYRFWRESPSAKMTPDVAARVAVLDRWMAELGDEITRVIRLDEAAEITVDGRFAAWPVEVRVGDHIGFEYFTAQEGLPEISPEQVRLSRAE